ncbi:S1 RNA-binding domain-containing protein [Candidatus Margulisiibacteriota bacterium]
MSVEVGGVAEGKVTGITKFGAFVDLGESKVGLIHISQVAHSYVKDVNEFLKVGDQIQVKVVGVTKDGKYDLSIKQLSPEVKPADQKFSRPKGEAKPQNTFEDKITAFLKQSEEKLLDLKRNISDKQERPKKKKIKP